MSTKDTPAFNPAQFLRVPDVASLQGPVIDTAPVASLKEGQPVWVDSLRTYWRFSPNQALFSDAIVVQNNTGGGQFLRDLTYRDESWFEQGSWYLDGDNGNDENDGATAGTALASWNELVRRLGEVLELTSRSPAQTFVFVLAPPAGMLSWQVSNAAQPDRRLLIKTSFTAEPGGPFIATSEVEAIDAPTSNPGHVRTAALGSFTFPPYNTIAFFPTYQGGNDAYAVVTEQISDEDGRFSYPQSNDPSIAVSSRPSVAIGNLWLVFSPPNPNILSLKSSPNTLFVEASTLNDALLESVSFLGCILNRCRLDSCSFFACSLGEVSGETGNHLTGTSKCQGSLGGGFNYGACRVEKASQLGFVNMGRLFLQTEGAVATSLASLINWEDVETNSDSYFGGGGGFPSAPGTYIAGPGSTFIMQSATDVRVLGPNTVDWIAQPPKRFTTSTSSFVSGPFTQWDQLTTDVLFMPQTSVIERTSGALIAIIN